MILVPMTTTEALFVRQALSIALERHDGRLDAGQVEALNEVDRRIFDHEERHVGPVAARS